MVLVIVWHFLNFGLFFWPFLGIAVKTQNILKSGNSLNFHTKNSSINIWVPKMRFSKINIFGAPIELEGLDYSCLLIIMNIKQITCRNAQKKTQSSKKKYNVFNVSIMLCFKKFKQNIDIFWGA